jgi:hypothetical protein
MGSLQNLNLSINSNLFHNYKASKTKFLNPELLKNLSSMRVTAPNEVRSPIMSNNNLIKDFSLDRVPQHFGGEVPSMLTVKESPDYSNLPNTY